LGGTVRISPVFRPWSQRYARRNLFSGNDVEFVVERVAGGGGAGFLAGTVDVAPGGLSLGLGVVFSKV